MYQINFHKTIDQTKFWKTEEAFSTFESPKFLNAICEANHHIDYFFVEITKENKLVGKLFFQVLPFEGKELKSYISDESPCFVKASIGSILEKVNWQMAVLGNLFVSGDNGQYWNESVSSKDKWMLLNQISKEFKASKKIDTVLLSELTTSQLEGSKAVTKEGFKVFEIEPELFLDIPENWTSFDDYLSDLKSKYKKRTRKVLKDSAVLEVKKLSKEEIFEAKDQIHSLYKNVTGKIDFKLAEVSDLYFYNLKDTLQDSFTLTAYYFKGEMIGFITTIENNGLLEVHLIGLNYEVSKSVCLYQRILYDCLEEAILKKKTRISFGKTAGTIKTSVGAKTSRIYAMLKHSNAVSNLSIKPFFKFMKPEEVEMRNPFKVVV